MPADDRVIAISSNFHRRSPRRCPGLLGRRVRAPHEIRFAAYNQLFQEPLGPTSLFSRIAASIEAGGARRRIVRRPAVPGGHFHLRASAPEFLTPLDEDLNENHRS